MERDEAGRATGETAGWLRDHARFEFASPEAEALYGERATLIRDAFEMKEPARVPVFPAEGFFPLYHAGFTIRDALYDYDKFAKAIMGYYTEFQPDAWSGARVYVTATAFISPTLKAVMLGLVEEGCIPVMFAEGSYNQRLEIIADFPKGKCIWWFDQTGMGRAKEILGDVCCIAGNVPTALMAAGTPDEVKACCKELIEVAGKDGGFILTNGCGVDHAKAQNVKAMIEAGKEYGVYR